MNAKVHENKTLANISEFTVDAFKKLKSNNQPPSFSVNVWSSKTVCILSRQCQYNHKEAILQYSKD